MKKNKAKSAQTKIICVNKKAKHNYFIKEFIEAGIALFGWEVKSLRAKKAQLVDSYILIKKDEAYTIGTIIIPLVSSSNHHSIDPTRTRKLLLHKKQIIKLKEYISQKGNALIPIELYWKKHLVKLKIGIATGKKQYDKRETIKNREWKKDKERIAKLQVR